MNALIGHTGFVGGNLRRQAHFDELFNSGNVDQLRNRAFDVIACAGAPGEKWRANQDPGSDRSSLRRLVAALEQVTAERFALVSTIDVYPSPDAVDEQSQIRVGDLQPYGRHRLELEDFVRTRFPDALIIRLPGLFGPGLKKNAIWDLINDHHVERIDARNLFQFYDVRNLWSDIEKAWGLEIPLLNMATQPTMIGEVAEKFFERKLEKLSDNSFASYDFRSIYAEQWSGEDGYLYSRDQVLTALADYLSEAEIH